MDDNLSWRAQLARSNINILNITWNKDQTVVDVFFEFMYRPYNGQIKWCKTWVQVAGRVMDGYMEDLQEAVSGEEIAQVLRDETLKLRKELER